MEKKPDGVVWDEKEKEYNAHLLPYASSLSGTLIEVPNVDAFKQKGVTQAKQQLQAQWEEMQTKMKAFAKQAQLTERIYSAKFKFEPVVGELYFLYTGKEGDFLSIIPPEQWKKDFVGAFRLNSEYLWETVDRATKKT